VATVDVKKLTFEEIINDVTRITAEISGKQIPSAREDLFGFGVDSLTMLDLLAALEEHFGITLSENIAREFRSVEKISRIVRDTGSS
jgi:acyl carrier protein